MQNKDWEKTIHYSNLVIQLEETNLCKMLCRRCFAYISLNNVLILNKLNDYINKVRRSHE